MLTHLLDRRVAELLGAIGETRAGIAQVVFELRSVGAQLRAQAVQFALHAFDAFVRRTGQIVSGFFKRLLHFTYAHHGFAPGGWKTCAEPAPTPLAVHGPPRRRR